MTAAAACVDPNNADATHCELHTHHLTKRIYVASSWRNDLQQGVVQILRAAR